MEGGALIGLIVGVVGALGAVGAYTRFVAQAPLEAKVTELEGEVKRQEQRQAELQERHEAELESARKDYAALEARFENLRRDFSNLKGGRGGVVIKSEIDSTLLRGMNDVQATESSVLVPGPPPSSSFVFLSIYGPAAAKLRYSKLPINKGKAGKVFRTGRLDNSSDPRQDSEFFEEMDKKGAHTTRTLLTVPVNEGGRTIGIVQFLNKQGNRPFSPDDESVAAGIAAELGTRIADFTRDTSNFELLGLSTKHEGNNETVVFCDLSASATLFDGLAAADAIDCINEYFERQSEIAIGHGATVDKYMGDGIMLRFTPRPEDRGQEHASRAAIAAWRMVEDFQRLRQEWLDFQYAVEDIHTRVGIACGPVYEAILGHRQHQHITVIGDTVNTAANLCDVASRTSDVILVNAAARESIGDSFVLEGLPEETERRLKSGKGPFYSVVGLSRATVGSGVPTGGSLTLGST